NNTRCIIDDCVRVHAVYFDLLGALVWAQSSVFVHLKVVDIGWVDKKPCPIERERLYGKDNGSRNGVIVFSAICLFLSGA
ncbi:unnamed protein product, partial [Sphagnum balticum]